MERTVKKCGRRPTNAFLLFCKQNRRTVMAENPGVGNQDISRLLGTLWSQLESNQKQEFLKIAEELRAKQLKETPGYKLNLWTAKRLREKQEKRGISTLRKNISSNHYIVWRPTTWATTTTQMPSMADHSLESQTNSQFVCPKDEPLSEEKRTFLRTLGLCQRNSTEYFNIETKLALNARKYHIFTFSQKVHNTTKKSISEDLNKVKRSRGRPRKYLPKIGVNSNQVNIV